MPEFIIDPLKKISVIKHEIYGHFIEHLGRCIYDGLWVGSISSIPNTCGFRNDIISFLKKIKIPVIRWPGGCFADTYHWQDGIGPVKQRPRRVNIHWGECIETNEVGTHEFINLCNLTGAKPYICGNLGSGTVKELKDWVEYCNFSGDSSLAILRKNNGAVEPFKVKYWGIGNENWGCGGNFSPEDYCSEYKRYASFIRGFGSEIFLIACGPSSNDTEWTLRFFHKLKKDYWDFHNIHGFAIHYYCGTSGTATEYTKDQWYSLIANGLFMEDIIINHRQVMDNYDPNRRIGLVVDEWGAWHPSEPEESILFQQNTIRDAIVAATTLDIFNRNADKVVMTNIAQTVNVLQSLILTKGEKMLITPTGHVYEMYKNHQNSTSVKVFIESETVTFKDNEKERNIPAISGSASLKDKNLFITITNCHADKSFELSIKILGGINIKNCSGRILSSQELNAKNTFERPDYVFPKDLTLNPERSNIKFSIPPASIVAIEAELI